MSKRPPASQELRPFLEVITGGATKKRFFLEAAETTIGRGLDASITLVDDEQVLSRVHARLERRDREVFVHSEGANGTAVGGTAVGRDPRSLRDGDLLVLAGKFKLRFGWAPIAGAGERASTPTPAETGAVARRSRRTSTLRIVLAAWGALWVGILVVPRLTSPADIEPARTTHDLLIALENDTPGEPPATIAVVAREVAARHDRIQLTRLIKRAVVLEQQRQRGEASHIWRQVALRGETGRAHALARHARAELQRLTQ